MAEYIVDTSLLLAGKELPPGAKCWTTPEAAAEVSPGGRDAARFQRWQAAGLAIQSASLRSLDRVGESAMAAGNLGRLSEADQSLLALALDNGGVLLTDDKTMQDIAHRLDVRCQGISRDATEFTMEWQPRCTGCGRWFDAPQKHDECPICASPVVEKRRS